jgi:hypothetical protein
MSNSTEIMSFWMGDTGYSIPNSLRFRASNSASLTRTFATPTSTTIWTFSTWVKRGSLGAARHLFGASTTTFFGFNSSDQLTLSLNGSTAFTSTAVFRDPTAHMHVVYQQNGSAQTCWVNNTSVATGTTAASIFNTAIVHTLGASNATNFFDGLMSNVTFVDGQALTPSSFGETNVTSGQWFPKAYSGTYGTNGFLLEFKDATSTTTIGNSSTGSNNWTTSGISVTAGVTFDQMTDTPTLNTATLNPLVASAANISWANLRSGTTAVQGTVDALLFNSYWEVTAAGSAVTAGTISGTGTTNTTTVTANKVFGFRLTAAGALDFINITDAGSWTSITTGLTGQQFPYGITAAADWNFGQRPFIGSVPGTYAALNTTNLSTPSIANPASQFQAVLRTGTGATASVSSLAFQPDLVWIKGRSGATDHGLYDSSRGVQAQLESNTTTAETTETTGLTAFLSSGYTVGALAQLNTNTATYVDWSWKKGVTPGFDIVTYTGTGAALTPSHALGVVPHLMIVKNRTGVAANWAVYHRNMAGSPQGNVLNLNGTAAVAADLTAWNNTAPTSSVFSVGISTITNVVSVNYVNYLFTSIPGFSLFGSYTGNGSADGPFVWCGFKPRWLMVKAAAGTSAALANWFIYDTARNTFNVTDLKLAPNLSELENGAGIGGAAQNTFDLLASGFKARTVNTNTNESGTTYIFAAFAESPFKTATAR